MRWFLAVVATLAVAPDPLSSMAYFVGSWQCDGVFPRTGATISSTISFEADAKLGALIKHHDDTPPNAYHALEIWVYSANDHHYNAAIADNFGGVRQFTSPGWDGDRLTWTDDSNVTPAMKSQRFVYERQSPSQFKLDWQTSRDGTTYLVGDTLTCKRHL